MGDGKESSKLIIKGNTRGPCGVGTIRYLVCQWIFKPKQVIKLQRTSHTLMHVYNGDQVILNKIGGLYQMSVS